MSILSDSVDALESESAEAADWMSILIVLAPEVTSTSFGVVSALMYSLGTVSDFSDGGAAVGSAPADM